MWYYNRKLIEHTTGISLADQDTNSAQTLLHDPDIQSRPRELLTLSVRMNLPFIWAITIPHNPYTTQIDPHKHILFGDSAIGMLSSFNRELRDCWRKRVAYRYY